MSPPGLSEGQAGINPHGWRGSDLPRGSLSLESSARAGGERLSHSQGCIHPAKHPEAIKELQPPWPRALPGRSAWEQMVKGLIEFGCSSQEALQERLGGGGGGGGGIWDSGAGSPCQELQESSINPNEAGGALAVAGMCGLRGVRFPWELGPELLVLQE